MKPSVRSNHDWAGLRYIHERRHNRSPTLRREENAKKATCPPEYSERNVLHVFVAPSTATVQCEGVDDAPEHDDPEDCQPAILCMGRITHQLSMYS